MHPCETIACWQRIQPGSAGERRVCQEELDLSFSTRAFEVGKPQRSELSLNTRAVFVRVLCPFCGARFVSPDGCQRDPHWKFLGIMGK